MGDQPKNPLSPDEQKDLETLLAEIGGGRRLIIDRKTPTWCDGHVQTIEIASDDAISLEDIEREVGGHKFEFKVFDPDKGRIIARRTVKFSGSPPRKYGRLVTRAIDDEEPKGEKKDSSKNELLTLFMEGQKQLAQVQADNQKALMEIQQKHSDTIQKLLMDRLEEKKENSAPQQSFKETLELFETLENFKDRLKDKGDTEEPVVGQLMDMANTFLEFTLEQQSKKIDREIQKEKANQPRPLPERTSRASSLSDLEDSQILNEAATRFKGLPPEKQKKLFELFLAQLAEDEQKASVEKSENEVESLDTDLENDTDSEENSSDLDLDSEDEEELDGAKGQAKASSVDTASA